MGTAIVQNNMNCKCAHFWGAMSLLSVFLTIQAQAIPDPCNGRFEFFDYNSVLDINTPTDWQCENYTDVVGHFIPHPEQGGFTNWRIDTTNGLFPFEGEHFLVLSTGDIRPEPSYAKAWQTITVEAEDKLTGVYFFGTCDYKPYYDFAYIKLIPPPGDLNLSEVNVVQISISDLGDFSSMSGWKRFEYTFDVNQAGTYDLTILVGDYVDAVWDTYFIVDGIVLCHNPPPAGDLSCDCTVDFQDFAFLAKDWLCDCNDPDSYKDPNTNCLLGTDLTGDGPVDINDLQVMSEHWLEGTKE